MEIESYFPSTVKETEEFNTIAKAENPLIADLWEDLSIILEEMFIMTMGIEGIERFEKMLDIKPESEDLEERRKTIIAVLMGEIPYTLPFLVEKAKEYFGDDTTVSVEYEKYLVTIKAYDRFEEQQRAFKVFLRRILPANMLYHLIQGFKVPNVLSIRANLGGSAFMKMPLGVEDDYPTATDISMFTLSDDGTTITGYTGSDTEVVIPKNVGITTIGDRAFMDKTTITSVTIPNSVTSIGELAFFGCSLLNVCIMPDSIVNIERSAFAQCKSLLKVIISKNLESIAQTAFGYCPALTSVIIPNGVEKISSLAFTDCTALEMIVVPESISFIGSNAFKNCSNLTEIIVNQPKGSLSGSPWGAKNATVIWKG